MQLGYTVGNLLYQGKPIPPELQAEADDIAKEILAIDPGNILVKA